MGAKRTIEELLAETEQRRLDLIRTDIELCHTLAGIAETELRFNDPEHARQALARARKGCADMERIFGERRSWSRQTTAEIAAKLAELRQVLDRLQQQVDPSTAASNG